MLDLIEINRASDRICDRRVLQKDQYDDQMADVLYVLRCKLDDLEPARACV